MMIEVPVMSWERFSKYKRLCRSITFVFKFVIKLRHQKDQSGTKHIAKSDLIKHMQSQVFNKEIHYLKKSINMDTHILINNLYIFLDTEGTLCVDIRISNSRRYRYDENYLNSYISPLYGIDCVSFPSKHLSIDATVKILRETGYYVSQSRHSVRSVIPICYIYKKSYNIAFKCP